MAVRRESSQLVFDGLGNDCTLAGYASRGCLYRGRQFIRYHPILFYWCLLCILVIFGEIYQMARVFILSYLFWQFLGYELNASARSDFRGRDLDRDATTVPVLSSCAPDPKFCHCSMTYCSRLALHSLLQLISRHFLRLHFLITGSNFTRYCYSDEKTTEIIQSFCCYVAGPCYRRQDTLLCQPLDNTAHTS